MKERTFKVTVRVPDETDRDDLRDYVGRAVQVWRGSLRPEDPLFDLEFVKCVEYRRPGVAS